MATPAHFGSLLKLLDDENEEVQQGVQQALLEFEGDASHDLAALGIHLKTKEAKLLSRSLHAGRQKQLQNQWIMPAGKLRDPEGDYEVFESLLRLISDFLHDGVTLRPSLSDQLDLLAKEARLEVTTPDDLAAWLFDSDRLSGNRVAPFDPRNSDLAWCLEEEQSNPIGLSIIYLLVAQRLELPVYGVNYPGHFLTLINTPKGPTLIDAFHDGRQISVAKLLADHPELSPQATKAVRHPCPPGVMLLRVLTNLNLAFLKANRPDDAAIIQELMKTFNPMTIETHQPVIDGHRLHRLVLSPTTGIRGGLVFFHGQGDFIDRYPPLLEGFVEAGYQCILTDLPGHGRSSGKRGHVPGTDFIDELLADSLKHLTGPCLIAGHSMGGLMALRLLLCQPDRFAGAWFSSPLLRVLDQVGRCLRTVLPLLSKTAPRLTVATGVTSEQCGDQPAIPRSGKPDQEELFHNRISLGWGFELSKASDSVWEKINHFPADKPILFTQGTDDVVCPPAVLNQFLGEIPPGRTKLDLIDGARHQPFTGSTRETFLERLHLWIKRELAPAQTPPPENQREV